MNGIQTFNKDVPADMVERAENYLNKREKDAIVEAVQEGAEAVTVAYPDLAASDIDLADDLIQHPRTILEAFRQAIERIEIPVPGEEEKLVGMDVRFSEVDAVDPIVSELRNDIHLGKYIGLRGQVGLATQVQPKLMEGMFRCEHCSTPETDITVGPEIQNGDDLSIPDVCPNCENKGPFSLIQSKSVYQDHQLVELTDPPGENPGTSNDMVPVHLYGDLAGIVAPGDRVRINGIAETKHQIIRSRNQSVSRRQEWQLKGHSIDTEEVAFEEVEPERVDEIQSLAQEPNITQLLVDSFAPDIITKERGDKHKLAVLLSLFGGASTEDREDINIFLVGAPGTGKSAYLSRASKLAPKAVKASGKGATAAGLTATATKSETTGKWMLKAGALVLASGGVACIDEFDKMPDGVRKSMHESMEDQEIPINKAGINTTLTTETTVIAAANPKGGYFDRYTPMNEQLDLGSPLISRFDLIFGVTDDVNESRDREIATHQHERAAGDTEAEQPVPDELLTEYIAYARQNVTPTYPEGDDTPREMLVDYYIQKRAESDEDGEGAHVTARMNDALRRLAQASARMHLREEITVNDAKRAIDLMNTSLGDTALDEDGTLNYAKREGHNLTKEDRRKGVREIIKEVEGDEAAPIESVKKQAEEELEIDKTTVEKYIQKLKDKGSIYEPSTDKFRTT